MYHIVHSKRHIEGEKVCRRIGNLQAEWAEKSCVKVFGIDGEVVGLEFSLCLTFYRDGLIVEGDWIVTEFVAGKCKQGDSSVVRLKCSSWENVELQVQKAERELLKLYTKDLFVSECQATLGYCISELEEFRRKFKESGEQELVSVGGLVGSSVLGVKSYTRVNLSLGLGVVGDESLASCGSSSKIASDGVVTVKEAHQDSDNVPGEPSSSGCFDDLI